ncbi:DUF2062 domain-containing protein [Marichromatium bheemlicum]|uniref:DUF2062 domain-containing protein n=1 Tax=Marichromatium bheemlicum TaxID=365339 RepID=A0ABX1I3I1_9GAMM|nr:DUF2062 domain-containing protein [Marichromatium bheemlicum]NKN32092.1 DUF2062 domain-containing protein [Marichromatium bheemlicum]
MPDPRVILENRQLGIFGKLLQDPNLWHLNRHSVSGAVAVGLFVMYLPPLGHLFMATGLAIVLRVNLPISVTLIWISNPITIPPMFYGAYALGCWMTDQPVVGFDMHFWIDWHNWLAVLAPLLLGSLVCATLCAVVGYLIIQMLWRWLLMREIQRRRERYRALSSTVTSTPSSSRQR